MTKMIRLVAGSRPVAEERVVRLELEQDGGTVRLVATDSDRPIGSILLMFDVIGGVISMRRIGCVDPELVGPSGQITEVGCSR